MLNLFHDVVVLNSVKQNKKKQKIMYFKKSTNDLHEPTITPEVKDTNIMKFQPHPQNANNQQAEHIIQDTLCHQKPSVISKFLHPPPRQSPESFIIVSAIKLRFANYYVVPSSLDHIYMCVCVWVPHSFMLFVYINI